MTNRAKMIIIIALALVAIFPRVLNLDAFRTADEKRRITNTDGFVHNLAYGQFDDLMPEPHPGLTIQWLGATTVRFDSWEIKKLPLTLGAVLIIGLIAYSASRLWGFGPGAIVALVLSLNPLIYGYSRVYTMDTFVALFSALSLILLLLWHQSRSLRYLIAAGTATAASVTSKLPGIVLLPISLAFLAPTSFTRPVFNNYFKPIIIWLLAFLIFFLLLLPPLITSPNSTLGNIAEYFRSDQYNAVHSAGIDYYLRTLLFFSSPLHWLAIPVLIYAFFRRILLKTAHLTRRQLVLLVSFAGLYFIVMTLATKKGHRYILPVFTTLDLLSALAIVIFFRSARAWHRLIRPIIAILFLILMTWQAGIIWRTHPHTLAYINPLTVRWFGDMQNGWGEGLDLAADYLNTKPNAQQLKAASFYPNEFGHYFVGQTKPAHQHDEDVDYVIIYRAMFGRGPDAWETDVVNQYRPQKPEKIISLGGLPYVWIYPK